MRYKLTKDLPTHKAGTPCHISAEGNLVVTEYGIVVYAKSTLSKFPNILTEWFEPVPEKRKAVPTGDELHYWIDECGGVYPTEQCHDDELRQGNWRWTREEAEAEVVKRAAIERVRRYLCENNLLEEDKTKPCYYIYVEDGRIWCESRGACIFYSPYGRIKYINIANFIKDCRDDLLLIHS